MGGTIHVTWKHDDDCLCLVTRRLADCQCQPEVVIEEAPSQAFSIEKIRRDIEGWKKYRGRYN